MSNNKIHFLCAGAAQGLVKALQPLLLKETGASLEGRYGAVGVMKEALLAGEPCDLMIVTEKMIAELATSGELRADSMAPLGRVRTGIAVPAGAPQPAVETPEGLKAALLAASAIYFPDQIRSTAGIHFAAVMVQLGIHDELESRFRTYPNGATAMRAMASDNLAGAIGCTQITEINYSDGITLVGALPQRFELATVYAAAISAKAAEPQLAASFIAMLAGDSSRALREAGGFEF